MDSLDTKALLDAQKKKMGLTDEIEGLGIGIADEKPSPEILSAEAAYGTEEKVYGTAPRETSSYGSSTADDFTALERAKADIPVSILESMSKSGASSQSSSYSAVDRAKAEIPPQILGNVNTRSEGQNTYTGVQNNYTGTQNTYSGSQNTYTAPNQAAGYSAPLQSTGYSAYSGSTPGNMGSYVEENNVLTRVNKAKKTISNAESFLLISGFINTAFVIVAYFLFDVMYGDEVGKLILAFMCLTPLAILPLAFGVEKKSLGCAIAALVIASLDLLLSFGSGGGRFSFIYKGAMVVSLASAIKAINDYHALERQYSNHPNYRIAELFDKSVGNRMSGKHIAMIICMVISLCMGAFCTVTACAPTVSAFSSGISDSTKDMDSWTRYEIGEKNISVLLPHEPETETYNGDTSYSAYNSNASVVVTHYPNFFEGYSSQQAETFITVAIDESWYADEGYKAQDSNSGELSCGKYNEMIFYNESDDTTIVSWVLIRNNDLNEISIVFSGTYEENKETADKYLGSIRGVY